MSSVEVNVRIKLLSSMKSADKAITARFVRTNIIAKVLLGLFLLLVILEFKITKL